MASWIVQYTYVERFKPEKGIGLVNATRSGKSVIASLAHAWIRLFGSHRLISEAGRSRLQINPFFGTGPEGKPSEALGPFSTLFPIDGNFPFTVKERDGGALVRLLH